MDLITGIVTGIDPTLSADQIATAMSAAVPRVGQRQRLARVLQDQPDLLTGAGAKAPVPSVLRLIDKLCDTGAQAITHPACPGCGRGIHLHRPIDGQWLCRNCTAKTRALPCSRCGAVREAATRDEHGKPLCPYCLISDPANLEICIDCGRRRRVSVRTPDGPLCEACRPVKSMTCSICGREVPCYISLATGQPWCEACRQRWARCAGCDQERPVRGGTLTSHSALPAPATTQSSGAAAQTADSPAASAPDDAPVAPSGNGSARSWETRPAVSTRTCKPCTTRWPQRTGPIP